MTITVYADMILPASVIGQAGLAGKSTRRTNRAQATSGYQQINVEWSKSLREYDIGFVPMKTSVWSTIEGFFEVTAAGAFGFLLEDPKDSQVTVANGIASLVSGSIYQLQKQYVALGGSRTNTRNITRPKAAGFAIFTSGTPIVTFTLDAATGRITIPSNPAADTLTWSGSFYTPVHFASDDLDWELVTGGPLDSRLIAGRSVMLKEVRE